MKGRTLILLLLAFLLGFLASEITTTSTAFSVEERPSPHDRVEQSSIRLNDEQLTVPSISGYSSYIASFTDTNSMDPVIDDIANAIELIPKTPEDIRVGDIVSYRSTTTPGTIIHRVVEVGEDEDGWYCIMRGDNLNADDPERVRFSQITGVVWAILY